MFLFRLFPNHIHLCLKIVYRLKHVALLSVVECNKFLYLTVHTNYHRFVISTTEDFKEKIKFYVDFLRPCKITPHFVIKQEFSYMSFCTFLA